MSRAREVGEGSELLTFFRAKRAIRFLLQQKKISAWPILWNVGLLMYIPCYDFTTVTNSYLFS